MRTRARAASLVVAAFFALALLPAAAQAQDPIDSDGDAVSDLVDNCPLVHNPGQENLDGDSLGDACDPDDDNDAAPDAVDNCPRIHNLGQADSDGDGVGDECEAIVTNDGFVGGGGLLGAGTHVSLSLHSRNGRLTGTGRVVDDATTVEILDLIALSTTDAGGAAASGTARMNGTIVDFRLSLGDGSNFMIFHAGGRFWLGALTAGNFIVK